MVDFLERIGMKALNRISSSTESFAFSAELITKMINPKSYNPAVVSVLIKQIYFTSVQLLPFFILLSILIGSAVIGLLVSLAINYGLIDSIGSIIVNLVMDEFAPFITVLLLALRSGAAMNTEIAVMKVSRELKTLEYFKIDPFTYLYIPRVLNGMISMLLLAGLFAVIAIASGYFFLALSLNMGIRLYVDTIIEAISLVDIFTLILKSILFGYALSAIPIYRGTQAMMRYNTIPIAVLQGMVKLFVAIIIIEVLSFVRLM
ncbi:MAG: ABC transporter permease [Thiovulaceae bacterium]|nr:ABC transporter permease [Sulfurimonadaceae bacterium]